MTIELFLSRISFRTYVLAGFLLAEGLVAAVPDLVLLAIIRQLDSLSAALLAIPSVIFAVKIPLVTEISRGIVTERYVNAAKNDNQDPFLFVHGLNNALTWFNVFSFLAVLVAFGVNGVWGDDKTLSYCGNFGVRIGLSFILGSYFPLLWVVWKVHVYLRTYLRSLSSP